MRLGPATNHREAHSFDRPVPNHLAYRTLMAHRARLGCRRLVLTHPGDALLRRLPGLEIEAAADDMAIVV